MFFFSCYVSHLDLNVLTHSSPTRLYSDLALHEHRDEQRERDESAVARAVERERPGADDRRQRQETDQGEADDADLQEDVEPRGVGLQVDMKRTALNSSHLFASSMPTYACKKNYPFLSIFYTQTLIT